MVSVAVKSVPIDFFFFWEEEMARDRGFRESPFARLMSALP